MTTFETTASLVVTETDGLGDVADQIEQELSGISIDMEASIAGGDRGGAGASVASAGNGIQAAMLETLEDIHETLRKGAVSDSGGGGSALRTFTLARVIQSGGGGALGAGLGSSVGAAASKIPKGPTGILAGGLAAGAATGLGINEVLKNALPGIFADEGKKTLLKPAVGQKGPESGKSQTTTTEILTAVPERIANAVSDVSISIPDPKVTASVTIPKSDLSALPSQIGISQSDLDALPSTIGIAQQDLNSLPSQIGIAQQDLNALPSSIDIGVPSSLQSLLGGKKQNKPPKTPSTLSTTSFGTSTGQAGIGSQLTSEIEDAIQLPDNLTVDIGDIPTIQIDTQPLERQIETALNNVNFEQRVIQIVRDAFDLL